MYFEEDATEYDFVTGMAMKLVNPSWTIKTDYWGYFFTAFDKTMKNSNSYWKDYDVLLCLVITAGVTGILWIITTIIEMHKFAKCKWNLAKCVSNRSDNS